MKCSKIEKASQSTFKECHLSSPMSCDLDPINSNLLGKYLDSSLPSLTVQFSIPLASGFFPQCFKAIVVVVVVVVIVDPTPPTCCQQSPAHESCASQQSLPPGGKERLHFVGISPEVQARKGGW